LRNREANAVHARLYRVSQAEELLKNPKRVGVTIVVSRKPASRTLREPSRSSVVFVLDLQETGWRLGVWSHAGPTEENAAVLVNEPIKHFSRHPEGQTA
jgi:hypothetical protein